MPSAVGGGEPQTQLRLDATRRRFPVQRAGRYGITSTNASWSSAPPSSRGWIAGSVELPMNERHSVGVNGELALPAVVGQIVAMRPATASRSM